MAQIQLLEFLDDENTEAILKISSEEFSLLTYCHPYVGLPQIRDVYLMAYLSDNICVSTDFHMPVQTDSSGFSYQLVGQVISRERQLVRIGEIRIYLDVPIPKDIRSGEYISFSVTRFDIFSNT